MAERKKGMGGYGDPPQQFQFEKGKSGNERGRPKGARSLKAELEDELREVVTIAEGGRKLRISKGRLMLKSLVAKAIKGSVPAAAKVIEMAAGPTEDSQDGEGLTPDDEAIIAAFLTQQNNGPSNNG